MKKDRVVLGMIMLILTYEWLSAAWEKFSKPDFMNGITQTLQAFASKNPHSTYVNFLNSIAIPNASLFGELTRFGELLVGLGLLVAAFAALRAGKLTKNAALAVVVLLFIGFFM